MILRRNEQNGNLLTMSQTDDEDIDHIEAKKIIILDNAAYMAHYPRASPNSHTSTRTTSSLVCKVDACYPKGSF